MEHNSVSQNVQKIKEKIRASCTGLPRNHAKITILAATKGREVERINAAIKAGLTIFGENYVQEAEKKISELQGQAGQKIEWHFIGHLQGNKAKKAVQLFDCIQSLDSLKLARKIDSAAEKKFPVFVEVNVAEEKSKFGVTPRELPSFLESLKGFNNLVVRGLMCMAPFVQPEQTRPYFQKMKRLAEQFSLKELSMGMSNDYWIAVQEGSTMLRLGTALFGKREK